MRCNVDLLKIIQVGLTLADEEGNFPQEVSTWQFNFKFSARCVGPGSFGGHNLLMSDGTAYVIIQRGHVRA